MRFLLTSVRHIHIALYPESGQRSFYGIKSLTSVCGPLKRCAGPGMPTNVQLLEMKPSPLGYGLEIGAYFGGVFGRVVPVGSQIVENFVEIGDAAAFAVFAARREVVV